jgi:hypothetical protein
MAKSVEHDDSWAEGSKNLKTELDKDAEFLRSLDEKQAVALRLTEELAAWFGDHTVQPARI